MDVSAHLWFLVPVEVLIPGQSRSSGQNIFQVALPSMAAFISTQSIKQRLVRRALQIHIQRGVNAQATLVNLVAAIFALEVTAHFFDKIGGQ